MPEGSVAFADNGTTIAGCDAQPLNGGIATCITSALPIGSHDITGAYAGSPSHAPSTSPAFQQTVTALATTTALSADVNPSTFGDVVTYTAVVAAPAGNAPTDGTVTFRDGADVIGSGSARRIRRRVALHLHPRRGQPLHHGRVRRQRDPRREHVDGARPAGRPDGDHDIGVVEPEPFVVR